MKSLIGNILVTSTLVALLAGCNEEVERKTGHVALAVVAGEVAQANDGLVNPHVGLVWTRVDDVAFEPLFATESAPLQGNFPEAFNLSVFSLPPSEILATIEDGDAVVHLGFAEIFAFEDVNGDGTFTVNDYGIDAPDRMFGISWLDFLVYLDAAPSQELAQGMFSNPENASAGFHLVRWAPCDGRFEILAPGTVLAVRTFEPSSQFPATDDWYDEVQCQVTYTGACANPDSPECQGCLDAAYFGCTQVTCGAETQALDACIQASGCLESDDWTCLQEHCGAEADAVDACMNECDDWMSCFYEEL
ncbi:hypothetical protein [Vulgatibacter incomptus]|nr:hypothetical protein [Vulgatibacter incomptus]